MLSNFLGLLAHRRDLVVQVPRFGSVCEGKSVLGDVCRYVKPMYSLTQERNEQCSVCVVVAGRNAIEGTLISILSFSHYAVTRTTCAVVAMTRLQRC